MTPAIGFIGFGEAGSTIAKGLRSVGVERLFAFDINTDAPRFGPLIHQRAVETGTTLVESSSALARSSELLFSTVTSSAALDAAQAGSERAARSAIALRPRGPKIYKEVVEVLDRVSGNAVSSTS